MSQYKIRFVHENGELAKEILVPEGMNILDAAEDNELFLPFSCRAGCCATCTGKILRGRVDQSDQGYLDDEQIEEGFVLLCVAKAESDCSIMIEQQDRIYG